jgi:predicted metal-dependent peptidase
MSGDCGQFIESDYVEPFVPWQERLNQAVATGISENRRVSKRRINRRNEDFGFGRVPDNETTCLFICDTSGSMGAEELSKVNSQLDYLANFTGTLDVMHADWDVAKVEPYRKGMKLEEFFGRGGTSFEPSFTYIKEEMEHIPEIIVYFTDGYGGQLNDDDPIIGDWESMIIWVLTPHGMSEEQFRNSITEQGQCIKVEEW